MNRLTNFAAITILLLAGCQQKEEVKTVENKPVAVKTTHVVKKNYAPELSLTGTFCAFKEANLGTALPGKVEKIFYPKGARVNKGELLVQLSEEMLIQAQIEHDAIQTDFEKIARLKEKGSVTEQDYDHLKAKLDASEAKVKMLRKNTEIRAPFSGVIADYLVQEGENYLFSPNLEAGYSFTSGIVSLMQINRLIFKADINEKDLKKIKRGMHATIYTDVYPGKKFEATVSFIEPALNMLTHSATIELSVNNGNQILKPGMFGKAQLKLPEDSARFVPQQAVVQQPGTGNNYVFAVKNNTAERHNVNLVKIIGEEAIIDGLAEGTEIISTGKNKVQEGQELAIKN